jgi:NSS family neurotransmitter:Na+ symporter
MQKEYFTSRWGIVLASLGMAVGTGNVWRFPRIAAQNGGGAFLIPWILALFLWSIPILMMEYTLGKNMRKGPIGAIGKLAGKKYNWMGGFVAVCTMFIMFYYSVVMGWCIKYFLSAMSGKIFSSNTFEYWDNFTKSYQPVIFHFISILIGSIIVFKGIVKGIEKVNKFLIPALFIMLIISAIKALTLDGSYKGLNFLFNPDWEQLKNYKVWLEGLSQSAWSTGAGWGLILTYAVYMKKKEEITLNTFTVGLGNNIASLIAGITVLCTVFAVLPEAKALEVVSTSNEGLTFMWIPELFKMTFAGGFFASIFFLLLTFAALSSLIAMIELSTRVFIDIGLERKNGVIIVGILGFIMGIPSAISLGFFQNQDWVWGVGLLLSGIFIVSAVIKYGVSDFRENLINSDYSIVKTGKWFDKIVKYIIPVEFAALVIWWFYQSIVSFDSEGWWNPFHTYSVATCIFQWGLIIIILLILNKFITERVFRKD